MYKKYHIVLGAGKIALLFFLLHTTVVTRASEGLQGIRSNGMGAINISSGSRADAAWYNPALLIASQARLNISSGLNSSITFNTFAKQEPSLYRSGTDNRLLLPLQLSLSYRLNNRIRLALCAGTSHNVINWPDEDWAGRFIIKESNFSQLILQPSVAIKLTDFLSVAAGAAIVSSEYYFHRALPLRDQNLEARMSVSGKSIQYGYNIGLYSRFGEKLGVSFTFKSPLTVTIDDATTTFVVPASLQEYFDPVNKAEIIVPVPSALNLSAEWQQNPEWILACGMWYRFKKNAGGTNIDFRENSVYLQDYSLTSGPTDEIALHGGAEYRAFTHIHFRAGTWYQWGGYRKNFISPAHPFGSTFALTGGASFIPIDELTIDMSFIFKSDIENNVSYSPASFSGSYKSWSFIPGVGVSYSF